MTQGYTLATFPKVAQHIHAQPEKKQAKELCKNYGNAISSSNRDLHNVKFLL